MEDKEKQRAGTTLSETRRIMDTIGSKRLQWAGRDQNPLLRTVPEKKPTGKGPLGRIRTRWNDEVYSPRGKFPYLLLDMEILGGSSDWKG